MKKELSKSFLLLKTSIKKHSPEILTGIGIAGMITTTVMAVRATPKALILIEERKEEIGVNQLEAVDLIKTTWMCYVPAALTGTLSIACLIGASSVNVRRNAALATAYTLSESALKDYQEKVIEKSLVEELSQTEDPLNDIYYKEIQLIIKLTLSRLPEQRRKVFEMSRFETMSNNEIAEKLNISVRTVEHHIYLTLLEMKKISFLLFFALFFK